MFFLKGLHQGNGMIVIIIILFILAAGASVGIYLFLKRRRIRQERRVADPSTRREDEIYNVAEQLKQMTHQIEEASEDEGLPSNEVKEIQKLLKDIQVQVTDLPSLTRKVNKIEPDTEMPQLWEGVSGEGVVSTHRRKPASGVGELTLASHAKEGSKKVAHQVEGHRPSVVDQEGTTKSRSEIVSRRRCEERSNQKLEKSEDDDISILSEKLTKLSDEYEETYQKLRQIIANKYKQLQDVSQYINTQTERLKKLTAQGNTDLQGKDARWEGVSQASHAWEGVSQASHAWEGVSQASHASESTFNEIETPEHPPKYTEVQKLAEQGIDRAEIARRTELPIGEVDLLLSLTKVQS